MKSTLLILVLFVSVKVWSCAYPHDVTTDSIDNLPILAFFSESKGSFRFRLYLSENDNFLGLRKVDIFVMNASETSFFNGSLFMHKDRITGLQVIDFVMSKDDIPYSGILIIARENDITPDGDIHSCMFTYKIPLSVLCEHFKGNEYGSRATKHPDHSSIIEQFKKKKYIVDRKLPNQKLEPTR